MANPRRVHVSETERFYSEREKSRERSDRLAEVEFDRKRRLELEKQDLQNRGALEQQEEVSKTALAERGMAEAGLLKRHNIATPLGAANIDLLKQQKKASEFTLPRLKAEAEMKQEKTRRFLEEGKAGGTAAEVAAEAEETSLRTPFFSEKEKKPGFEQYISNIGMPLFNLPKPPKKKKRDTLFSPLRYQ